MINLKNLRDKKIGVLGLEKTGLSVVKAVEEAGGVLICWAVSYTHLTLPTSG